MKELHSCEQVQSWAKLRMMDWALSGLQLVLGGNKWSGRHAEYTTLARETPMVEHLGNLFGENGILTVGLKTGDDHQQNLKCCFRLDVHVFVSQKRNLVLAFLLTHRNER